MNLSVPWAALGFVAGLIAGSFLATLVLRWPKGRSVVAGRSHCDACGITLPASSLVPFLSWIAQRGACRACGARIDPLHPGVELACALAGGLSLGLAPGPVGLGWTLFLWLLVPLALLDLRHFWLPDRLVGALGMAGLLLGDAVSGASLADRAIGMAAGFALLWAVAAAYRALRGRDGMGGGDPKLFGALGAWTGWAMLPALLASAALVALLATLIALRGEIRSELRVPFGAALAACAPLVVLVLRGMPGTDGLF